MTRTLLALLVALALMVPVVSACPMCKEAIQSPGDGTGTLSPEEQEGLQTAKAYNASILMMVGMPYLLVGTVGFLVYRSYKNKLKSAPNAECQAPLNQNSTGG